MLLKRYLPSGETRAIYSDDRRHFFGADDLARASLICPITSGKNKNRFFVSFEPLAEATGEDRFRICLTQTFETYKKANEVEVEWLRNNWVLEGT